MEPVTHVLTGMCLARSGLHRRAAYATAAMGIAAELPDIDTLWGLRGPVSSFQHHRGITHTFIGIPFEAALVVLVFFLFHRWRTRRRQQAHPESSSRREKTRAPLRWGALYAFTLVALLSHILLDFTNNYGVRPFFPFNPHWYAASIVFIFDPLLFVFLLAGLLMPSLFGLVGQEIAGKSDTFRGSGWARVALIAIVGLWLFRAYEHSSAVELANAQTLRAPASAPLEAAGSDDGVPSVAFRPLLQPLRSLASPDPLSPFRWYVAADYGPFYELGTADTRLGTYTADRTLNKTPQSPLLLAAERTRLGQVYLDWSPMPWITFSSDTPENERPTSATETAVTFQDTRFMNSLSFLKRQRSSPLSGQVVLDKNGRVLEEGIGGRFGK